MPVHYELRERVALITLERRERRNAVNKEAADRLREAWQHFDSDGGADVAVFSGADGVFSAGADLKDFDLVDHPDGFLGFTRMVVSKPTIAAVEGYCVAGGLEMALWCDLRVAGDGAVFGCFERRFGVPLVDGGTQRLPRLIGTSRALDMILTGRPVEADEAHQIGLADRVVPAGSAVTAAVEIASAIASFPQETVRSDRMALLEGLGRPIVEGLEIERRYGLGVLKVATEGAARFAGGAGRRGAGI
jgi:enoyl-CoA hydratase